ncbi:hypothetical protein BDV96DRAFT_264574 [Lophiotrema nucula]|uniref:Uncharacterized protein n=1 Tax=Lophiotrema nucula TaxID=690887 RepID=A0A6A5YML8_9PLEO|nr:hypothetical protein BDV96DRAFT_264574 [Lophiotrema nucula]
MFFTLLRLYDTMTPPTTTTSPRQFDNNDGFPYKSHPLYKLRLLSIITALLGFALNLLSIGTVSETYEVGPFMISLILLFISLVFILVDLYKYAKAQLSSALGQQGLAVISPLPGRPSSSHSLHIRALESSEYHWPPKSLLVIDIILALAFQWLFWGELFAIVGMARGRYYYTGGLETIEAYANLCNFAASVLHGVAFWKELMARKKEAWRRDLEARGCERCGCGAAEGGGEAEAGDARGSAGLGGVEAALLKPSFLGDFGKGKVVLPKWAQGPNARQESGRDNDESEEPLLATPDESAAEGEPSGTSDYGTLGESMSSVPETIVKKKEKGKKRLVDVE